MGCDIACNFASNVYVQTKPAQLVSDWKRKKTNPSAEKIMDICYALDITPEQLLTGVGIDDESEIKPSTD